MKIHCTLQRRDFLQIDGEGTRHRYFRVFEDDTEERGEIELDVNSMKKLRKYLKKAIKEVESL